MSRAKLGLYVFANVDLFLKAEDLQPVFRQFLEGGRSTELELVFGERHGSVERDGVEKPASASHRVTTLGELASIVQH
eukprot:311190-Prorocentrum_lima.AAC.1